MRTPRPMFLAVLSVALPVALGTPATAHSASRTEPAGHVTLVAAAPLAPALASGQAAPGAWVRDEVDCDRRLTADRTYRAWEEDAAHNVLRTYRWTMDAQGRPHHVGADKLARTGRENGRCIGEVGRWGGRGFHGGHLIAASLGGPPLRYNLAPQWDKVNIRLFAVWEGRARKCLDGDPNSVTDYSLFITYPDRASLVPKTFDVTMSIKYKTNQKITVGLRVPNDRPTDQQVEALRKNLDSQMDRAHCGT